MSTRPLIVVTGATGLQGGSVAKYLLEDGTFRVRATTRNTDSAKAKELAAQGAEIVHCDFDSVESVVKAFEGAYGVFGMTNFWDPKVGAEHETFQGKIIVDAAKANGVKHFVWSTLEHTSNPDVVHWTSKAKVNDYLHASGVPYTSLYTVMFIENFINFFPLTKSISPSGTPVWTASWPMMASDLALWVYPASHTGVWVREAFKKPSEWLGKDMRVITELITPREFFEIVKEEAGTAKEVKFEEVDREAFEKAKDVPALHELWANFRYFYDHDPRAARDFEMTKRIHPDVPTVRQWVKDNLDRLLP